MPSRAMAGDWSIISFTFSSSVNLDSRSSARSAAVSCGFWYGNVCAVIAMVPNVMNTVASSFLIIISLCFV